MHDAINATASTLHVRVLPHAWMGDLPEFEAAVAHAILTCMQVRPGRLTAPVGFIVSAMAGRVHGLTRAEVEAMAAAAIDVAFID